MQMRQGQFTRAPSSVVGGFSRHSVSKICPERTINCYPVYSTKAKNQAYLNPWPGLHLIGTIGTGPIRSSFVTLGKNFIVSGRAFYYLDSALLPVPISGNILGTSTGFVSSASNLQQVAFCDSVNAFYYNGTSVVPMPIPSGIVPAQVCAFDNYIVVLDSQSNRFFVSAYNDVSTWDPTRFAQVTSTSTTLVAAIRLKRRLFIFGYQVGEVWFNAGASSFPLRRDDNLLIEHGIEAVGSIAQGYDLAFYLARDQDGVGSVMMISGTEPIRISNLAVDLEIQAFAVTSDATGSVFKINSHIFYQINFTSENRSFLFDLETFKIDPENAWTELMMLDRSRYLCENHAFFQNKHLMFAYNGNQFYELNEQFFDNDGEPILRERIYRILASPTYEQIKLHRYYLDLQQGLGDLSPPIIIDDEPITSPDTDPKILLGISEDGGLTFKDYGAESIGQIGQYIYRTFWTNLGQRRDHIGRLTTISKRPFYLLGASVDYTVEAQ